MTSETLSASQEDYLEAIFRIVAEKGAARVKDIAGLLSVQYPSVTGAMRLLSEKNLVNYAPYDVVTLTARGKRLAADVVRRHEALRDFFVSVLAADEAISDEAACRMEHAVPREILDRLIRFVDFVKVCPRGGSKWINGFAHYCDSGEAQENCERCVSLVLDEVREGKRGTPKGGGGSMTATLKEIRPGQKARVVKVECKGRARKRIAEMGVTPGTIIEVERVAPLGDPVEIRVKGYRLSLRKEEADGITVEPQ